MPTLPSGWLKVEHRSAWHWYRPALRLSSCGQEVRPGKLLEPRAAPPRMARTCQACEKEARTR